MIFKTGHDKASKFTAENYGTKISVEIDHSDLTLDEVMDAFETLIIGMGYHADSLKNWIIDRADEHRETDNEKLKEQLEEWKLEDDDNELRHHNSFWQGYEASKKDSEGYESGELENDFFGQIDESEKRMDIIGQNGNEGLHYRATQEDEDEFSNDGGFDGKPQFEWGDESEDEDLFEGDEWKPNQKMVEANERYKSEIKKKMNSKKRNKKD
jgi:hypothetical protein